ncbi:DUF6207 family protein [Streptomyces sp. JV185]|uniref:DUF6207 family protein n=1 Tax=Streptomyces sp. JV185 TaxID=858638 RepID=UPI002E777B07|nr:DUF6207 family protein [Streptomyces sp. JV185]MEE1766801.1 DUF6207 family protein [Streptomyces sp. JV185]
MEIDAQHIDEPGLVVLDITAADEETAHAVMAALEQRWATSGITPVCSEPGVSAVTGRSPDRQVSLLRAGNGAARQLRSAGRDDLVTVFNDQTTGI